MDETDIAFVIARKRGPSKAKAVKTEPEDDDDDEQKVTPVKSRKRGSSKFSILGNWCPLTNADFHSKPSLPSRPRR